MTDQEINAIVENQHNIDRNQVQKNNLLEDLETVRKMNDALCLLEKLNNNLHGSCSGFIVSIALKDVRHRIDMKRQELKNSLNHIEQKLAKKEKKSQ